MFGGRFSLKRFSLPDDKIEREIDTKISFIENIKGMVSLGSDIAVEHNFREIVRCKATGTRSILYSMSLVENIRAEISAVKDYVSFFNAFEDIKASVYLASDIYLLYNFKENINSNVFIGKDIFSIFDFTEEIQTNIFMGKDIYTIYNFKEEIHSIISFVILDKDIFVIAVSILPGSELRINSENFSVTLDGKNIIHNHTGDWIQISRHTTDITITNGFAGSLLYTERFL